MLSTRLFLSASGVAIAVIAAGVIAGFILGLPVLTDWSGAVPMAIPTALCFLLTGSAFIALAGDHALWRESQHPNHHHHHPHHG